jgi:hypothetical protein
MRKSLVSVSRSVMGSLAVVVGTVAGLTGGFGAAGEAVGQVVRSADVRVGPGGPGAAGRSGLARTITKPMMEKYAGVLGLDATQREAATTFHEAYQAKAAEGDKKAADARKKMKEMMEDGDRDAAFKKMGEMMGESATIKAEASKELLENLKALLTEGQAGGWEKLERLRRRESIGGGGMGGGMGFGMASGATVDLTDVVAAVKLPEGETAKIAGIVEQYELAMDSAIKGYQAYQEQRAEEERKEMEGRKEGEVSWDLEKVEMRMKADMKESAKLREVNAGHVRKIGDALSEEWRAKIEKEWLTRAYRRIFGESHTTKQLKAAVGFGDLSSEQKEKIEALLAAYEKDAAAANQRWLEEQRKAEAEGTISALPFRADETDPEGLRDARKARKDLDTRISKTLRETLTETQRERLPKRQGGMAGGMEGMEFIGESIDGGGNVEVHVIGPG